MQQFHIHHHTWFSEQNCNSRIIIVKLFKLKNLSSTTGDIKNENSK